MDERDIPPKKLIKFNLELHPDKFKPYPTVGLTPSTSTTGIDRPSVAEQSVNWVQLEHPLL